MRVLEWEKGTFPDIELHVLAVNCYHCENPVCVDNCKKYVPGGAIYKEDKYGAVLIDVEKCDPIKYNCKRACFEACPYGSIVFASDASDEKAHKCTMCIDRLEQKEGPMCVFSCSLRALDFGPLNELKKKYGALQQLEDMPLPDEVKPAVVFKKRDQKKQLIPYDSAKALDLWKQRGPFAPNNLPPVFESKDGITNPDRTIIGRNKLVLKAKDTAELMYYTIDDE
jgi:anaerobic dimethyl sulfoxide reductase subunit B (iron-sulfur subunit)